jgi:arylsulfatase A
MSRSLGRVLVAAAALIWLTSSASPRAGQTPSPESPPNVVIFLMDDMGYSDLSFRGHPTIETPSLDRLAREGLQLTSFYAAPACSQSRAMLLTSRYPPRTGLLNPTGPASPRGIQHSEVTMAEALKARGYRTAMLGKWHLGDFDSNPEFNPTKHGFDSFLGIPYSHDYDPPAGVPLYRGMEKVEQPVVFNTMTRRFTEEAVKFIRGAAGQPFFLYIAHPMPHVPLGTSDDFKGHSRAGRYGDVIEELDWSVGQVLATLEAGGLERRTIVVFASDNGPWVVASETVYDRGVRGSKEIGDIGWAGLLRGSKASTWEGGIRVPAIVRWPGRIPAGRRSAEMVSIMDIFPTILSTAGGSMPKDRPIDGLNMLPLLLGAGPAPRQEFFYFIGANVQAVRQGPWKLTLAPSSPELFNLDVDPSERFDKASAQPELARRLQERIAAFQSELTASQPAAATTR